MKALKKVIGVLAAGAFICSLTACDFNFFKKSTKKTTEDKSEIKNGLFKENRSYSFNYNKTEKISGEEVKTVISWNMKFDKDGNVELKDLGSNTTIEYTYTVGNNLITCTNKTNPDNIDYYYYYDTVIVSADLFLMPGTLDGVAVSQNGTGTLAYVSYVMLTKGDLPAVLSKDKSNLNKYYALKKNGTVATSGSYVIADQLGKFDTSAAGRYVTTLTVGSKTFPVIVYVEEVIN